MQEMKLCSFKVGTVQPSLSASDIDAGHDCYSDDEESDYDFQRKELIMVCKTLFPPSSKKENTLLPELETTTPVMKTGKSAKTTQDSKRSTEGSGSDSNEEEGDEKEKEEGYENVDQSDDEAPSTDEIREEVFFMVQDRFRFHIPRINRTVYKVFDKSDVGQKTPLCMKITKMSSRQRKSIKQQNKPPLELRILSFVAHLPNPQHLQVITHMLLTKHAYIHWSPFIPALTDLPEVDKWNQDQMRLRKVMQQLFTGLQQLHEHGIIHRDIKPSNLLWDEPTQNLIIADFGHATWKTTRGHHILVGTEGFMAPEVLSYERDTFQNDPMPYDEKCDIYSAGMVFGSLLVSLPEVCVEEYHATLFRNTVAQYIPSHTSHLLVQLLEPDPKKRLAAKDILQLPYFTAIMS